MGVDTLSAPILQDPPDKLVRRTARVATGAGANTIRVPHDRFSNKRGEWYAPQAIVSEGNQVKFLIDGKVAFPEMAAAIRTANKKGHFIYMLNWFCDVDFDLTTGEHLDPKPASGSGTRKEAAPNTLRDLLTKASDQQVMIRAMFWKSPVGGQNVDAVRFLNSFETQMTVNGLTSVKMQPPLFDSAAIHDDTGDEALLKFLGNIPILSIFTVVPRAFGSRHQKVLCISGEQGLVCFCGGIDFNPDRVCTPSSNFFGVKNPSTPLHDVHCRILGPAGLALVQNFADRWNAHPRGQQFNKVRGPLLKVLQSPDKAGEHSVQIGRTFRKGENSFALPGEFTGAAMILKAIRNAKRFIYTECQYFTGDPRSQGGDGELEQALKEALGRIEHLTIVLTHWELSDLPTVNFHRRAFINSLRAEHPDKVRIFALRPADANDQDFEDGKVAHTYVHAKIWIVDDEFAVIGSLNSNRRSWLHDAEIAAGIYETSTDTVLHYRLAHWFRIRIWAEHLQMLGPAGEAELADGVASAVHWLRLPPGTRVRAYDLNEKDSAGRNDQPIPIPILGIIPNIGPLWDGVLDPSH